MQTIHNLGFPRIGARRELKLAVEDYWAGKINQQEVEKIAAEIRARHWKLQSDAGVQLIPVGDFAWYDHILEWSTTIGAVPKRFGQSDDQSVSLDTLFRMARGRAPTGIPEAACEMTKWFDTNYHLITPEIWPNQQFHLARESLFQQVSEAHQEGYTIKVVIPGPLTWLWLAKGDGFDGSSDNNKLQLLENLLPVYQQVLQKLVDQDVKWIQIDEPILVLDLPEAWLKAFTQVYQVLCTCGLNVLLATYFGGLHENLDVALSLPVNAIHVDLVRDPNQLKKILPKIGSEKILSVGLINGRNIWRTDLDAATTLIQEAVVQLKERLWIAPSCSLLHVPVDLDFETTLDSELKSWLSFAKQKLDELLLLRASINKQPEFESALNSQRLSVISRRTSTRVHNTTVADRIEKSSSLILDRPAFSKRSIIQNKKYNLPAFPTTTIGSFPQTTHIRSLRRRWKNGSLPTLEYETLIKQEIENVIRLQEKIGLDVLVHGEPERNDMVEYFGELLSGYAFTVNGWVQSYGSRCVKPPIIFGDILRPESMTVSWITYAQSLTKQIVKGMLTGPITMLQWSFVRDDQPRSLTCKQLALALRDEVLDLEKAGISIIQIDEAALREGLPLRKCDWNEYLQWAVDCFKLTTSGVKDETQIHTHMCYSEFNDIIASIAAMDADVITIETSRSNMELLQAFEKFKYPNDIGPGVYDIHSPNVPTVDWIVNLIKKAAEYLPKERLWVNPDCGLKTRGSKETTEALTAMVSAARILRQEL